MKRIIVVIKMRLIFILAVSILVHVSCVGQTAEKYMASRISPDSCASLLSIFWLLSEENITTHHQPGNDFYRIIIIDKPEGESIYEGETDSQLYVLKGEYGEYPDGTLYLVGEYLNIQSTNLLFDAESVSVVIKFGSVDNPTEVSVVLDK